MSSVPRPRKTACLSYSLQQRLNGYALAAGAAGVGVLALAESADAKVVYTPAHHVIHRGSHFALDLNHDGIPDFDINHRSGCTTDGFCQTALYAMGAPYSGNSVVGTRRVFDFASALKPGTRIGPKQPWLGFAMYYRFRSVNSYGRCSGSWTDIKDRYLGFRFLIKGKIHYGWARLNVKCNLDSKKIGVLTGYAYETIPKRPIIAGKTKGQDVITMPMNTGTLGELAVGRK
jgi:hypothetical protein